MSEPKEIILPSGRTALIEEPKVKHYRQAMKTAREMKDPAIGMVALAALVTTVDGERVKLSDWDEMPMKDLNAVLEIIGDASGGADESPLDGFQP